MKKHIASFILCLLFPALSHGQYIFSIPELQQIAACPDEDCAKTLALPRKYSLKETRNERGRIIFFHKAGSGLLSTLSNLLYMRRDDDAKQVQFASLNKVAFAEKITSQIRKEGFSPVEAGASRVNVNMDSVSTIGSNQEERLYVKIENGVRWTLLIYTDILLTSSSGNSYGTTALLTGTKLNMPPATVQNKTTTSNRASSQLTTVAQIKQQINRIWKIHRIEPFDEERQARIFKTDPDRANQDWVEYQEKKKIMLQKVRADLLALLNSLPQSAESLPYEMGLLMDVSSIDDPLYGSAENVVKLIRKFGNRPYRRVDEDSEHFGWTFPHFFRTDPRLANIPFEDIEGEMRCTAENIPAFLKVIKEILTEYESLEEGYTDKDGNKMYGGYYGDPFFSYIKSMIYANDFQKIKPWLFATLPTIKTHSLRGKILFHTGQYDLAKHELSLALTEYRQKGWNAKEIKGYQFAIYNDELLRLNPSLRSGLPSKIFPPGWQIPSNKWDRSFVMADFNADGLLDEAIVLTSANKLNKGGAIFIYLNQSDKKYKIQKIVPRELGEESKIISRLQLQDDDGITPINGLGSYLKCPASEECEISYWAAMRWDRVKKKMIYPNPALSAVEDPDETAPPTSAEPSPAPTKTGQAVVETSGQTEWTGGNTPEELGKILLKALKTNDQKLWAKTVLPLEIEGDKNEYEKWAEWHRTKRFELLREGLEGNGVTNWDLAVFSRVIYQSYMADDGIKMAKDPVVEFTYKNGEFIGTFNFVVFYRKDGKYYVPGVQPRILSKGSLYRNVK